MAGNADLLELELENGESLLSTDIPIVQGYMHEPRRYQVVLSDDSTSEDSSSDQSDPELDPRIGNNEWYL